MSIIRHRDGSENPKKPKIGVKKMASVEYDPKGEKQEPPKLNLNPGPKTTLVSGIVDQLIKSGYTGDLMSNAGMQYANPDTPKVHVADDRSQVEFTEDTIVDDINFESTEQQQNTETKQEETKKMSPSEIRKREAALFEERARISHNQIETVAKNARTLYGHVDSFISTLREAADQTRDNPRLGHKLENLRRLCVGFVRSVEQQMPHYATSLFVNSEENRNGQK